MKNKTFQIKISGDSMSPLFLDGDVLTVDASIYSNKTPIVGDIVLLEHPFIKDHPMVKKIVRLENDRYFVQGINTEHSTDSRHFGAIKLNKILGKILE